MRYGMRHLFGLGLLGAMCAHAAVQSNGFPDWAYPPCIRAAAGTSIDNAVSLSVPESRVHFSAGEIANTAMAPDWFPREHSPLPSALAAAGSGKFACAY